MPVPTLLSSLSTVAAANSPPGAESIGTQMNDYVQAAYAFIAQLRDEKAQLSGAVFSGAVTVQGQFGAAGGMTIGDNAGDSFTITSNTAVCPNGLVFTVGNANMAIGPYVPSWKFGITFDGTMVNGLQVNDSAAAGAPLLLQLVKNGVSKMHVDSGGNITSNSIGFVSSGSTFISASNAVDADFVMGLSPPGPNKYLTLGSYSANSLNFMTSNTVRFQIHGTTGNLHEMQADGPRELGYKGLPFASVGSGSINAIDRGRCVYANGNVTIPNGVMGSTDVVAIQNITPSNITIFAGLTLRMTGTTATGNRTLGPYGYAFLLFENTSLAYISGSGLT